MPEQGSLAARLERRLGREERTERGRRSLPRSQARQAGAGVLLRPPRCSCLGAEAHLDRPHARRPEARIGRTGSLMARLGRRIRQRLHPDEERRRSLRHAAILTACVGAAHAVLFLLSFYLVRDAPNASATDQEFVDYYSSGGQ